MIPPARMTTGCTHAAETTSTTTSAASPTSAVAGVLQNERAIPNTACATMLTATSISPWSRAKPNSPFSSGSPAAAANMMIADGAVKPAKAATPPATPA